MSNIKDTDKNKSQSKTYPLPTDKFYFREECLRAKKENEPLLSEKINYKGQSTELRRLAMKIMPTEWVAQMQDEDLCDAMQVLYAYVRTEAEGEVITLVERTKLAEYNKMLATYETLLNR